MSNYSFIHGNINNSLSQIFFQIFSSKFGKNKLRSESISKPDEIELEDDKLLSLRGKWSSRKEFLFSCIGFAVGFGNIWRFPIRCYESGGGAFLFLYVLLCLLMGVPLLFVELGLGQFSSRSPTTAFKLVPIFYGVGWSMVVISVIIEIYYGVVISWAFIYLFGSFNYVMPWTVCDKFYNTDNCMGSIAAGLNSNISREYVSSASEFWDYYVTGFIKYPSRTIYTMNENPGLPQWHVTLSLLLTWILTGLSIMYGVKVTSKVMYFTVIFPYIVIGSLVIVGYTLPGSTNGIYFYLIPNWKKIYEPAVILGAIEQLFFSTNLAMGGMLTYASYNNFRDNIYQDTFIIMFVEFLTSFLSGFAVFSILGYMAQRLGVPIDKVIKSGEGLFYITYTDALATLPGSNFWNFIFMLMAISLGLDSQFAPLECILTGISDVYPCLRKTKLRKAVFTWVVIGFHFICGIMLCSPGGKYWFVILDSRVSTYGLPIVALLEILTVGVFYGFNQLRYDFEVMMGFSLNIIWMISLVYICPVILIIILIFNIFTYPHLTVLGKRIPFWGDIMAFIFLIIVILPIIIGIIHTMVSYKRKYPELNGKDYLNKLFATPIYWGPYRLKNWLFGEKYREKIIKYQNEPRFLKYRLPDEDVAKFVNEIKMSTE